MDVPHTHCNSLNDRFLCTNRDNDLKKCEIFLGYFGRMRFVDTRPIKWDRETLESLSESDESIEIPQPMRRTPIKPKDPRPPKPQKNFGVSKPTKRQLALLAAKESPKCFKVDSTTENESEPEKVKTNREIRMQKILKVTIKRRKTMTMRKTQSKAHRKTLQQKTQVQSSAIKI